MHRTRISVKVLFLVFELTFFYKFAWVVWSCDHVAGKSKVWVNFLLEFHGTLHYVCLLPLYRCMNDQRFTTFDPSRDKQCVPCFRFALMQRGHTFDPMFSKIAFHATQKTTACGVAHGIVTYTDIVRLIHVSVPVNIAHLYSDGCDVGVRWDITGFRSGNKVFLIPRKSPDVFRYRCWSPGYRIDVDKKTHCVMQQLSCVKRTYFNHTLLRRLSYVNNTIRCLYGTTGGFFLVECR